MRRLKIHSLIIGIFDPACELLPPWTKELYMCTVAPLSSLWPPLPFQTKCTVHAEIHLWSYWCDHLILLFISLLFLLLSILILLVLYCSSAYILNECGFATLSRTISEYRISERMVYLSQFFCLGFKIYSYSFFFAGRKPSWPTWRSSAPPVWMCVWRRMRTCFKAQWWEEPRIVFQPCQLFRPRSSSRPRFQTISLPALRLFLMKHLVPLVPRFLLLLDLRMMCGALTCISMSWRRYLNWVNLGSGW